MGLFGGAVITLASLVCADAAAAVPLSKKVTERVVDSAIDQGLEAMARPENQRRLGMILSSTAVTGGAHDIALAVVSGVLDGVEGRVKLDVNAAELWKGFDTGVRKHVTPAVAGITRNAVDAAMVAALSEENGARMEAMAAHLTHGAITGLAVGIREDLGPALAHVIEHDLAPAGAAAMEHHVMPAVARGLAEPAMQVAIAMTMSSVARSLVRGGDAGIETAKAEAEAIGKDKSGPLETFGDRVSMGLNVGLFVTVTLATLLVLMVVLLVRSTRGQQRLAEQGKRREVELLAMIERLDTEDVKLDKNTLRDLLQRR